MGPPGETGKMGCKGDTGCRGPKGSPGCRGCPGPTGPMGCVGPTGCMGLKGWPGPRGCVGATGPMGDPGRDGCTGSRGVRGPIGGCNCDGHTGPICSINTIYNVKILKDDNTKWGSCGTFNLTICKIECIDSEFIQTNVINTEHILYYDDCSIVDVIDSKLYCCVDPIPTYNSIKAPLYNCAPNCELVLPFTYSKYETYDIKIGVIIISPDGYITLKSSSYDTAGFQVGDKLFCNRLNYCFTNNMMP